MYLTVVQTVQATKIAQKLGGTELNDSKGAGSCILAPRILGPGVRSHGPGF